MYATVRTYAADSGLVDAIVEHESTIQELLAGIDGFRSYAILRTSDGRAASVSVYDDAAGAEASNAAAAAWVGENLPALAAAGPPQTFAGEVAVSF